VLFLFSSLSLLFRDGCIFSTSTSIHIPYFMNILFFPFSPFPLFPFSPFPFYVQGFSVIPSFLENSFTVYSTSTSRKVKSLFGYDSSVPFSHTNDPFPSVSKRREGHFHSRNGRPTQRSHFCQTGSDPFHTLVLAYSPLHDDGIPIPYHTIPLCLLSLSFLLFFLFSLPAFHMYSTVCSNNCAFRKYAGSLRVVGGKGVRDANETVWGFYHRWV